MDFRNNCLLRVTTAIVLAFFLWSFGGIFDIAYAINDGPQSEVHSPQSKEQRPEEKFQKAIEEIGSIVQKVQEVKTDEERENEKKNLRAKKTEIEKHDIEIRKQFADTETKIKDLPEAIKQRHKEFVEKYEKNLNELRANLDAIEKAKTEAEVKVEVEKAKAFIEKVKPPKKHIPLDPNKLPHRTAEPIFIEPRTSPEQFQKDNGQFSVVSFQKKTNNQSILVASNGPLTGLLSEDQQLTTDNYLQIALADPPTDADLAETIEVQFTPEIRAKAQALGNNPVKIYNWVRNNIEYVPTYGSIQGANMCLQTKQCNDFDTASLLIALLRTSGIHARYVYGTIEIPIEKVKNWVGGFTNSMEALRLIASGGIPVTGLTEGGVVKYVRMEHVWVEAWIDMIPSQGAVHKQGDTWVSLDASFKQYTYKAGIDFYSSLSFNGDQFLNNYIADIQDITSYQYYGQQMSSWIDINMPEATIEDILGADEISLTKIIIEQNFSVLLGTLPYKVAIQSSKYSQIPDNLRHKITFGISGDIFEGESISITKSLPELNSKRVTLSYIPATSIDETLVTWYGGNILNIPPYLLNVKPVLKVEGMAIAIGSTIGMGSTQSFTLTFNAPGQGSDIIQNNIIAGSYSAITIQPQKTPVDIVTTRMQQLRNNSKNINATLDDLLGELLFNIGLSYFHHLTFENIFYAKTFQMVYMQKPSEAITTFDVNIFYLYGVPYSASQGGFSIDVDRNISVAASLTGDVNRNKQFMKISGMTSSAWEHKIFEVFFDTPAVSALKLLKYANQQGVSVYTIDNSNINQLLPTLQVSPDVKADIQNAINAGKKVMISQTELKYNEWAGIGYIVINPATGDGAYMINGGLSGGGTTKVLTHPPITLDRSSMEYYNLKMAFINIVIGNAISLIDTKYVPGGNDPQTGFDCSGFTHYIYEMAGYEIPTRSGTCSSANPQRGGGACNQYEYFKDNGMLFQEPEMGDLFFWKDSEGKIYHTGIVGGITGTFITIIDSFTRDEHNNPVNKVAVRIFDMASDNYWIKNIATPGFGRPID